MFNLFNSVKSNLFFRLKPEAVTELCGGTMKIASQLSHVWHFLPHNFHLLLPHSFDFVWQKNSRLFLRHGHLYWETTAIEIFGKFGASKNIRNDIRMLEAIKEKPRTRRELQQRLGTSMSADEFNKTLNALCKAERLKFMPDPTDDKSKGKKRMIIAIQ